MYISCVFWGGGYSNFSWFDAQWLKRNHKSQDPSLSHGPFGWHAGGRRAGKFKRSESVGRRRVRRCRGAQNFLQVISYPPNNSSSLLALPIENAVNYKNRHKRYLNACNHRSVFQLCRRLFGFKRQTWKIPRRSSVRLFSSADF